MRRTLHLMGWLLSLSFVTISQAQQPNMPRQQGQAGPPFEVLYTSRLLGYLTSDDKAPPTLAPWLTPRCFNDGGADPAQLGNPSRKPVTQCFLDSLAKAKAEFPNALLIGMGDNLAPKYEARFLQDGTPKARTNFTGLSNDNVVEILQRYDALVPGKEDFYFGAGRLEKTASVLPMMNASNLTKTVIFKTVTPDPNDQPTRGFVTSHPNAKPFDDGHIVLEREDGRKPTYSIQFMQGDKLPQLKDTPRLNVCQADQWKECASCPEVYNSPKCQSIKGIAVPNDPGKSQLVTYDLSGLQDTYHLGDRLLMCFKLPPPSELEEDLEYWKKQGEQFCRPMTVDKLIFPQFPYLKANPGGRDVVIIAVVDPNIQKQIPTYNRSWEPRNEKDEKRNDVQVQVAFFDPASSIRQAYYECRFNHLPGSQAAECDDHTEVLLLAQTTLSSAEQLAGKLTDVKNLKLVVAQADLQPSLFGERMNYRDAGRTIPVIATRGTFFQGQDCTGKQATDKTAVDNPLHFIAAYDDQTVTHARHVPHAQAQDWCYTRKSEAPGNAFLDKRVQDQKLHGAEKVESFLVEQMRSRLGGDVALISQHEVFRDP